MVIYGYDEHRENAHLCFHVFYTYAKARKEKETKAIEAEKSVRKHFL